MIKVESIKLDTAILDKFAANLGITTDRALAATAHQVEGYAAHAAPVLTGALKNSIHTEKQRECVFWVLDGVEYGIYQELGTGKMAAHPFMVPAVESAVRDIIEAIKREYGK